MLMFLMAWLFRAIIVKPLQNKQFQLGLSVCIYKKEIQIHLIAEAW